jgi:superfamily II DNA/RNA helicase
MATFYDLDLDDGVMDAISMMGYEEPTPVQEPDTG